MLGKTEEYTAFPFKKTAISALQGSVPVFQNILSKAIYGGDIKMEESKLSELIATVVPAIDIRSQAKETTDEAVILKQAALMYKAIDEKDRIAYDYNGDEEIFYSPLIKSYVKVS